MPGLDGFGVIHKLMERKVKLPHIVFATAYDQYAVQAFEVNAVDYVLKPFDKQRVGARHRSAPSALRSGSLAGRAPGDAGQPTGRAQGASP